MHKRYIPGNLILNDKFEIFSQISVSTKFSLNLLTDHHGALHLFFSWEKEKKKWNNFSVILTQYQFSSVQSLSQVQLFATPHTATCQTSMSITNCRSLLKIMFIELVMPSNNFTLCCPLLLLPSIFPSNRVFSNESFLRTRWPNYWSFSFSISPSDEYPGL